MGLGNWPAWISAGVAVLGAIGSFVGFVRSRGARDEAQQQADRAERAVTAAQELVAEARRSADATEETARALRVQTELASQQATRAAERLEALEREPWDLEPIAGERNRCLLRNKTETPKYNVQVKGLKARPATFDVIGRGRCETLHLMRVNHPDDRVYVTWNRQEDLSDDPLDWDGNLPP
jgi:hypothetical protein